MPKSKGQASPERYQELNGGRPAVFVNYDMSEGEKKAYKKWLSERTDSDLPDTMAKLLDDGYQFSVKPDTYNDCIGCYLVSSEGNEQNKALILAGRGGNPRTAFYNAVYRHYVLFEGQWPEATSRRRPTDDE